MIVTCPNGHQSEMADYCDQCGVKIAGTSAPGAEAIAVPAGDPSDPQVTGVSPAPGTGPPAAGAAPGAGASPGAGAGTPPAEPGAAAAGTGAAASQGTGGARRVCPACNTARIGDDRFCEGCGYDFTTGETPGLAPVDGETANAAWEAIVTADREYYDRVAPEGVSFPLHCPTRHFLLVGDQIRIGRHSASRGVQAEVDLSGAPEDTAISHLHSLLISQADGSYSLIDPGSTNGTTLNDDPTPLAANVAVPIADGDRIHVGAWTTITVKARQPSTSDGG